MNDIIFLDTVFKERIWGGTTLLQSWYFNVRLSKNIGEAWVISAHSHSASIIEDGPYDNMQLDELYLQYPELFGFPKEKTFPLLIKILDAQDNLSVQVHPNDEYAQKNDEERGKTECWYILDAKPGANIILGHTAKSKSEFLEQVKSNNWEKLLIKKLVKKDDFFYIPSGTLHALGSGILALEVQQSSDTTYRVYDYDRKNDKGIKRELHLQQALDVMKIPHDTKRLKQRHVKFREDNIVTLISNSFFTVKKLLVVKEFTYKREANYVLVTIIAGVGIANGRIFSKGSSFIIPATVSEVKFNGLFKAILAYTN